jgi:site-specific DNA recombinase
MYQSLSLGHTVSMIAEKEHLWNEVRERLRVIHTLYGAEGSARPRGGRAAGSPHLFTGLLECSLCRGSVTIVWGQWKKRDDARYGCSMHAYRGDKVCRNHLLIARGSLEAQLLAGLQAKVLHPDVIA